MKSRVLGLTMLFAVSVHGAMAFQPPVQTPVETEGWGEVQWSAFLAKSVGGEAEHRLPDQSRVDILTEDVAWEVEWEDKWEEAVGQSLFYGIVSQRQPGIWILRRKDRKDDEDLLRVIMIIDHLRGKGVSIRFRVTDTKERIFEGVE